VGGRNVKAPFISLNLDRTAAEQNRNRRSYFSEKQQIVRGEFYSALKII
jgi:hypothetical protein